MRGFCRPLPNGAQGSHSGRRRRRCDGDERYTRVDGKVHRPSLEMPVGEDQDFLQHLLVDVVVGNPASLALLIGSEPRYVGVGGDCGVEDTSATNAIGDASSASGPEASTLALSSMTFSAESLMERQIIVTFMECSTRYAILRSLPHCAC